MLRILPQKPLEMVSVQAAAGSIIYKAMRVFYQSRKVELEEYGATSMLWEYTVMEWEHGPFSAARSGGGGEGALDIKQEQMEKTVDVAGKPRGSVGCIRSYTFNGVS